MRSGVTPEMVAVLAALAGLAVDEDRAGRLAPLVQIQLDGAERLHRWVDQEMEPDCRVPDVEVSRRGGR